MEVKVKRVTETATLPTRGSQGAAGYDLYADIDYPVMIRPNESAMIWSGISMEIPHGYFGAVYARSGLATRQGLRPPNCVGVIDEDYRGNIGIAMRNDSTEAQLIYPKERIAQIVIQPYLPVELVEVTELSDTERGTGGFGSSGS